MQQLLVCFLTVMSYAYGDTSIETMKAGLIEVHMSIRNNFEFRGEKLAPFTYSKELEDLALEWAKTCHKSEPKDPRFANLGNNVGSCPIHWPLLREWSARLLAQAKAYNSATGECLGSPCEHYRELVQPNNTKFGCAINVCHFTKPKPKSMLLSVCLYKAEKQSDPIQLGAHSVITTGGSTTTYMTTATSTISESDTTGSVELSTSSELPFVPISTEMEEIEADGIVKEDDEEEKKEESFKSDYEGDEEEKEEESFKSENEGDEEGKEKESIKLESEVDERKKEEQSYRSEYACDTTKVFSHLLSFAVVTIALLS
ncbi:Cysteine-rich secretory protein LCCL domain-containing 1 [Taenia solium]|eukprot:TsM_000962100 transcript=TsM_000962100 gene=TsM_000962100